MHIYEIGKKLKLWDRESVFVQAGSRRRSVPALPALDGLGSTAGGLTDPPEDKLEGEPPGWCHGVPPVPIRFGGGTAAFFTAIRQFNVQRFTKAFYSDSD